MMFPCLSIHSNIPMMILPSVTSTFHVAFGQHQDAVSPSLDHGFAVGWSFAPRTFIRRWSIFLAAWRTSGSFSSPPFSLLPSRKPSDWDVSTPGGVVEVAIASCCGSHFTRPLPALAQPAPFPCGSTVFPVFHGPRVPGPSTRPAGPPLDWNRLV